MRVLSLLLLTLSAGIVQAAEPRLPDLKLTYAAAWKGFNLGEIIITLRPAAEPDCYQYESRSDPVGMVRMFYGKPREISEFCVRKGRVVPRWFSFVNPKDESDNFTLTFDGAAGQVKNQRGEKREIPANAQDRFGLQQAVRLWVLENAHKKDKAAETAEFAMVDDDRIRKYRFAITSYEEIEVPAGRFETVLVQRVDDPRKTSKFWLAPARDYMPVKVEQIRDGDTHLHMVLKR